MSQSNQTIKVLARLIVLVGLMISACGADPADLTPTPDVHLVQTQAVATFASGLTQTALTMPTATPTLTATPTGTPTVTNTPSTPAGGAAPTASCYGATFVADVTIPDNTAMVPGAVFTKTWRIRNSGSCAWDVGFRLAFTGGDSMSGAPYTLTAAVAAGAEVEIAIAMTAPNTPGTIRGNWRMATAAGTYFGDEVYVQIIVGGEAPTATETPTLTSEP
ncbi:MAG: hypothetical protein JXB85_14580 [Anaerolineales bacterium]|nr:hypothetical protein [Anaerolineales bacterium]